MERRLVETLKNGTEIMFHNFYVTLVTCDMDYVLCEMPIWKHCYHALHSCDRWFINARIAQSAIIIIKIFNQQYCY